jgi:hypothetical protein
MQRLILLLATGRPGALEPVLLEREPQLAELARSIGGRLRLAVQLEGDPLAGDGAGDARVIRALHGVVDVTIEGDDHNPLLQIVAKIAQVLGSEVDWPASAVSIGVVREVVPAASETLLLTLAANRLPTIDRSAFHDYWLHTHAALAMSMMDDETRDRMGYQQVHADQAASARATELAGAGASSFDGVLQCALAQITDLPHLTVPGFAEVIMKDEENFADQSAEMFGAFTRTLSPQGASS